MARTRSASGMVLRVPHVLPWTITADLSVLFGLMFLGAAAYFRYALLRPAWQNTASQLIGFLAYDVVLIVPFPRRLASRGDRGLLQE